MDNNLKLTILLVGFALIIHSFYIYFSSIDVYGSCPSMEGTAAYLELNCPERKDQAGLEAIIGIALIIGMSKPDEEA